ncbi:MAG: YlbF family regulator [Acholeplasmataceae bacterium]|jgi:cell fate (sporulation/competence/biofilm development) regulator YmcA (YheA/YmcA/DUF963 family)|nr:YlbF family regulator [Acholeplasmataceae bacterium]
MSEKDKLIHMIQEDDEIQRYKKIEMYLNSNKELKGKFNQLKAVQKQLVNAKHIGKQEAVKIYQARYDELYEVIEDYPLMSDYLALQSDINDMIQAILEIIEKGLENELDK